MKTEGIYLFLLDLIQRNCLFLSMDEKKIAQQILKLSPTLRSAFKTHAHCHGLSVSMLIRRLMMQELKDGKMATQCGDRHDHNQANACSAHVPLEFDLMLLPSWQGTGCYSLVKHYDDQAGWNRAGNQHCPSSGYLGKLLLRLSKSLAHLFSYIKRPDCGIASAVV